MTTVPGRTLSRLAAVARSVPRAEHDRLTRRLVVAGAEGDLRALTGVLAPDAVVVGDRGGTELIVARGADDAARLVAALLGLPAHRVAVAGINGRLGIVVRRGEETVAVVVPEAGHGRIAALWVVRDPARLGSWRS